LASGRAFTVGIDLGTTHTVVAYARAGERAARIFELPQLVTGADVEALPLLPSFLYAPAPGEPCADLFDSKPWVVGAFARRRGQEVPSRLVSSAKSWLCHAAVDRRAAILPWGAATEGESGAPRVSPVEASQRLLAHVRAAWDGAFPEHPLAAQSIVLTVPASFDEAARELTVEAARAAGLQIRLLEEPLAAFYDFLGQAGTAALARLVLSDRSEASVLVCDVGGGTTDLTLIRAARKSDAGDEVALERVAVGRHLLLGGDNIDLALAHLCEARLVQAPDRLSPARFAELVLGCRAAKERLLGRDAPRTLPIRIAGSGSSLVGKTLATELTREEVEGVVFDGFLPHVERDARPSRGRAGLLAFGLPYEPDPAITRHIASFFARHSERPGPDALLLNGGLFRAERARERVLEVVNGWTGGATELLPHADPDLAVARGAVLYGLSLEGAGPRIGAGSAQGYYVAVERAGARQALCVLPRGAREGERHVTTLRGLTLAVGRPVRFELFARDDSQDAPGALLPLEPERFLPLPPVTATFEEKGPSGASEIGVALEGELSAIGTVDLGCIELEPPSGRAPRRFRLAFDLRADAARAEAASGSPERPVPSRSAPVPSGRAPRIAQAEEALDRVFGKSRSDVKPRETRDLLRELERKLCERKTWTLETCRALFDPLLANATSRRRSEDHERVFWMLAGYCLRPGFGHSGDPERVRKLGALFDPVLFFPQQARNYQQFWIAWRRVAAGLDEAHQTQIRDTVDPFLASADAKLKKPKNLRPLAPEEMLELAAWLERVPVTRRAELGRWLLEKTWTSKDPRLWAALGRLGARVPAYASVHHVVPPLVVEKWLDHLLRERWEDVTSGARAAFELARVTGDRARDLEPALRVEVARRLERAQAPREWAERVREFVPEDAEERQARFGEELPVGLRLVDDAG
jgi:molecular chaperone DnaK (HSP70)